jgi:hypothetical protein
VNNHRFSELETLMAVSAANVSNSLFILSLSAVSLLSSSENL